MWMSASSRRSCFPEPGVRPARTGEFTWAARLPGSECGRGRGGRISGSCAGGLRGLSGLSGSGATAGGRCITTSRAVPGSGAFASSTAALRAASSLPAPNRKRRPEELPPQILGELIGVARLTGWLAVIFTFV